MSARLAMPGFEPDSLMGFVAVLGAMRALREAFPDLDARTAWTAEAPYRLSLVLPDGAPPEGELADGAARWIGANAGALGFAGFADIKMPGEELRAACRAARDRGPAARLELDALAAIGSDGCVARTDGSVLATRLEFARGTGHQHFLGTLRELVERLTGGGDLYRALFEPWRRDAEGLVVRWDHRAEREHAYMASDPADRRNALRSDHAAGALVAVGFTCLATAPAAVGPRTPLAGDHGAAFTWPLWSAPLGLPAVLALASVPELLADEPPEQGLRPLGACQVVRARRYVQGQYGSISFSRGRYLW